MEGKGTPETGPVAYIPLPILIPTGLHGCFASDVTGDFNQFEATSQRNNIVF
jgi:hypothetical protein